MTPEGFILAQFDNLGWGKHPCIADLQDYCKRFKRGDVKVGRIDTAEDSVIVRWVVAQLGLEARQVAMLDGFMYC